MLQSLKLRDFFYSITTLINRFKHFMGYVVYLTLLFGIDAARSMPYAQLNGVSNPLNKGRCSQSFDASASFPGVSNLKSKGRCSGVGSFIIKPKVCLT